MPNLQVSQTFNEWPDAPLAVIADVSDTADWHGGVKTCEAA